TIITRLWHLSNHYSKKLVINQNYLMTIYYLDNIKVEKQG
ncbi:unnamed protein product, partial [marine sediment metagenome]